MPEVADLGSHLYLFIRSWTVDDAQVPSASRQALIICCHFAFCLPLDCPSCYPTATNAPEMPSQQYLQSEDTQISSSAYLTTSLYNISPFFYASSCSPQLSLQAYIGHKYVNAVFNSSSQLQLRYRKSYHSIPPHIQHRPPNQITNSAEVLSLLIGQEKRLSNLFPSEIRCLHFPNAEIAQVQHNHILVTECLNRGIVFPNAQDSNYLWDG